MGDNIAKYKKDNKDYSKYEVDGYVNQKNFNSIGNGSHFNDGHITDVEEMNFSLYDKSYDNNGDFIGPLFDDKQISLVKSEEQIKMEEEIDKINKFLGDDSITPLVGQYEQAKYQSSPNYVGYGPFMQAAQGNVGIFGKRINDKVTEVTNGEFTSYDDLKAYKEKIITEYNQKINDKEYLPDISSDPGFIALENSINFYSNEYNTIKYDYDRIKELYDKLPKGHIELYERYMVAPDSFGTDWAHNADDSPNFDPTMQDYAPVSNTGDPTMVETKSNLINYVEILNEDVQRVTNGQYESYEELLKDLNVSSSKLDYINGVIESYNKSKENYVYKYIFDSNEFKNYKSIYRAEVTVDEWISEEQDVAHSKTTYTFYDENGNIIPKTSKLYDKLEYLYKVSRVSEHENYIKSMLPEEEQNNINFNFNYYNMYLFMFEKYGEDVANKYFEDVKDEINCIEGLSRAVEFCEGLVNNMVVVDDLINLLPVHLKGIGDGVTNSIEGLLAWLSENPDKTANYYEAMWIARFLSTGNFGTIQGLNYELGQSLGNMLPSVALTAVNPYIGSLYLALSSGGNTYRNLRWNGVDVDTAIFKGLLSGASEVLTERWLGGLPFLSEVKVNNLKTWLMSAIREGNQEVLQDLVNSVLLGEDFTMEDAVKTWLIAALTAGEMNLPGLAVGKINKSNIIVTNGWLRVKTENGETALNLKYAENYLQEHPNASIDEVITETAKLQNDNNNPGNKENVDIKNTIIKRDELGSIPLKQLQDRVRYEKEKFDLSDFYHRKTVCDSGIFLVTRTDSAMTENFIANNIDPNNPKYNQHAATAEALYRSMNNGSSIETAPVWQFDYILDGNIVVQLCSCSSSLIYTPGAINEFQFNQLVELNEQIKTIYESDPAYFDEHPMEFEYLSGSSILAEMTCQNNIDDLIDSLRSKVFSEKNTANSNVNLNNDALVSTDTYVDTIVTSDDVQNIPLEQLQQKLQYEMNKFSLNDFFHQQTFSDGAVFLINPDDTIMTENFVRNSDPVLMEIGNLNSHDMTLDAIGRVMSNGESKPGEYIMNIGKQNSIYIQMTNNTGTPVWFSDNIQVNEFQIQQLQNFNNQLKELYASDPDYFNEHPMEFHFISDGVEYECINNIDELVDILSSKVISKLNTANSNINLNNDAQIYANVDASMTLSNPFAKDFVISNLENPVAYFAEYAKQNDINYFDVLQFTARTDIDHETMSSIINAILKNNLQFRDAVYNNAVYEVKTFMTDTLGCTDDSVIKQACLYLFGTRESFLSNNNSIFDGNNGITSHNWDAFVNLIKPYMTNKILTSALSSEAILWSKLDTEILNSKYTTIENCSFGNYFYALDLIFSNWNSDGPGTPKLLDLWQSLSAVYADACCQIVDVNGEKTSSIRLLLDKNNTFGECFIKSELPTILADGTIKNIVIENVELNAVRNDYISLGERTVNIEDLSIEYRGLINNGIPAELAADMCFEKFKILASKKKIFELSLEEINSLYAVENSLINKYDFDTKDLLYKQKMLVIELANMMANYDINGNNGKSIDTLSTSQQQLVRQAASDVYNRAKINEPSITATMQKLVDSSTTLEGLEYRLRSSELIEDEISRMVANKYDVDQAKNSINDSLSYTLVVSGEYKTTVLQKLNSLYKEGYKLVSMKNAWGNSTYQGLNITLMSPDGILVELQFHTPESFWVKQKNQDLYELSVNLSIPEEIRLLSNKIQALNQELYVGYDTTFEYNDIFKLTKDVVDFKYYKNYGVKNGYFNFLTDNSDNLYSWNRAVNNNPELQNLMDDYKGEDERTPANYKIANAYLRKTLIDEKARTVTISGTTEETTFTYSFAEFEQKVGCSIDEYRQKIESAIQTLSSGISECHLAVDTELVRGVNMDTLTYLFGISPGDSIEVINEKLAAVGEWTEPGFMSACPSVNDLPWIVTSKKIRLIMECEAGMEARVFPYDGEKEILLNYGQTFEIKSAEYDSNGLLIIRMRHKTN